MDLDNPPSTGLLANQRSKPLCTLQDPVVGGGICKSFGVTSTLNSQSNDAIDHKRLWQSSTANRGGRKALCRNQLRRNMAMGLLIGSACVAPRNARGKKKQKSSETREISIRRLEASTTSGGSESQVNSKDEMVCARQTKSKLEAAITLEVSKKIGITSIEKDEDIMAKLLRMEQVEQVTNLEGHIDP